MAEKSRDELLKEGTFLAASEPEDALEIVNRLLLDDPLDVEALSLKGTILEVLDTYTDARRCYEKILDINPMNARALIDVGDTYELTDDLETALSFYDRAIDILNDLLPTDSGNEDLEQAVCNKARILRDIGRAADAAACLNSALIRLSGSRRIREFLKQFGDS